MPCNKIHEVLLDVSSERGWERKKQIFMLCCFIEECSKRPHWAAEPENRFQEYLQEAVEAENKESDGFCENCGAPCEYDSEICICEECLKENS